MKLTESSIKHGVTFSMLYLVAVGFGLFSLLRLNLDLYPKMDFPMLAIIGQYSGVGPYDIETSVTKLVEETVASVENVKKVSSTSAQGFSLVMLEFGWGTDMDQAEIDVRTNLEYIKDYLPQEMSEPMVFKFDPSQQPILYMSVASDFHGQAELRRISEQDVEPRIERIAGVASAYTMGGLRREIKVLADPGRLRAHNVSVQQMTAALQMNNMQLPSGWIDNAQQEFTLKTVGEYSNLEQIENTSVGMMNGSVIKIRDVASVVDGFADQRMKVWNNNQPAVMLMVQKQSDANTVIVARDVLKNVSKIEAELPKGIHLDTIIDLSSFITQSMSNLVDTAYQAIFLTFLVLLFFLRSIRSSLIVAVSIPVSMIVTFAVMDQAGITLNVISMAGLALAIGMLVDNSIVVLESIFRRREEGEGLRDSAINGTVSVGMAITASTLTTLAVFVPILFVPGIAGELFKDMVLTIVISLSASLLVALTLVPLLTSRLLRIRKKTDSENLGPTVGDRKWTSITRLNQKIGVWLDELHAFYDRVLAWSLHHKLRVLLSSGLLFFLSIIVLAVAGGEFLPKTDQGYIAMAVDRSAGTSLESMEQSMHQLNSIIMQNVPEADNVYTNFGQGEGIFALFSSRVSSQGDINIKLKRLADRKRSMFEIQDALRDKFKNLPDVNARFEDRGEAMMMGAGGDIVVEIFGYDLQVAEALSSRIEQTVKKIKGVADTKSSIKEAVPELRVTLDRQRIADLGLSTSQISQMVSTSILGTVATQYRDAGNEYDIRVQLNKESRTSKNDVENLLIMTPQGTQIPLRSIATVDFSKAPQEILREDQERLVTIDINISGRSLTSVTSDVKSALKEISIPNDFRIEIGGLAEEQIKSFIYLAIAMVVAIILTYMVMASQFESFLDPFIIMSTVPLSIIGVAMALILTGTDLSVMAFIGIIMLVGIVVNNGIVLVDYINQLRASGLSLNDAITQGGHVRLRPVLMTALTTILGMFPLALGMGESGESWAPLARAVMGGMIVSTALTLVVVPILYSYLEVISARFLAKHAAKVKAKYGDELVKEKRV
jgi:HAE1 family hydrophobic/amphiphilic exporter-1